MVGKAYELIPYVQRKMDGASRSSGRRQKFGSVPMKAGEHDMITIEVREIKRRGKFEARLGERVLVKNSRTPLLDSARILLAEDAGPNEIIAMRRPGDIADAMQAPIGKAAKLTVKEDDAPRFAKWNDLSLVQWGAPPTVSPPMRPEAGEPHHPIGHA
jgi:hypothetical protein